METIFSINAHKWTQKSINSVNEKKYFRSWTETIPARLNYLANFITNICIIPFAFIKTLFGFIEYVYTWRHKTQNLTNAINQLYDYTNNSINSFIGIFCTTLANFWKNENNIKTLLFLPIYLLNILEKKLT